MIKSSLMFGQGKSTCPKNQTHFSPIFLFVYFFVTYIIHVKSQLFMVEKRIIFHAIEPGLDSINDLQP